MVKDIINQWNHAAQRYAEDQENGCGYGVYTDYFRSIGAEVIGIDG